MCGVGSTISYHFYQWVVLRWQLQGPGVVVITLSCISNIASCGVRAHVLETRTRFGTTVRPKTDRGATAGIALGSYLGRI